MEGSVNSSYASYEQESELATPYKMQIFETSDLEPFNKENLSLNSIGVISPVVSWKESSSSPSDSESEYIMASDDEGPYDLKESNNLLLEEANNSYDKLLKKSIQDEEELKLLKSKLHHSEEEIAMLKFHLEESKGLLDFFSKELRVKEDDLVHEKGQVLELQKQTAEMETHVSDCSYKIARLGEQLEVANDKLKISYDENATLREDLKSSSAENNQLLGQLDSGRKHIQEMENRITLYEAKETSLRDEMIKLKVQFLHEEALLSLEKDQLQSEIASLAEMKVQLTSRLEEWESKSELLESIMIEKEEVHASQQMVLQCEITFLKEKLDEERHLVEAMDVELELYDTQQMVLQSEKTCLEEELGQERRVLESVRQELELQVMHDMEAANNEVDRHKQKLNMLMTERNEAIARIDKLKDEISFQEQKADKERKVSQVHEEQVNKLKVKGRELQREVFGQSVLNSRLAHEEKREAIRQLCFSLHHYRSAYGELLQAFDDYRRHAVIAS